MTMKTPPLNESDDACLQVALCQVATEPWDMKGNEQRLIEALEEAADKGAELAITPECVLHGYAGATTEEEQQRLLSEGSVRLDSDPVQRVRALAKKRSMTIVFGFAERGEGDRVHNTAVHIDENGEVAFVYRKVHCRPFESESGIGAFTPGDSFHAADVTGKQGKFRVGTMICFDREIPESVRSLRALGSELIACPLATDTDRLGEWRQYADNEEVTRVRAAENEVFIVVVNHAGRQNGGSMAIGPGGEVLAQLGPEAEVRVVPLPVGAIAEKFHADPLGWMGWGYRRPEVYAKYLAD